MKPSILVSSRSRNIASPSVGVGLLTNVDQLHAMGNHNTIFMSSDKSGLGSWVPMSSRASRPRRG